MELKLFLIFKTTSHLCTILWVQQTNLISFRLCSNPLISIVKCSILSCHHNTFTYLNSPNCSTLSCVYNTFLIIFVTIYLTALIWPKMKMFLKKLRVVLANKKKTFFSKNVFKCFKVQSFFGWGPWNKRTKQQHFHSQNF